MNKTDSNDEAEVSFVKIENANMIRLVIKQISKLYTQYAKIILEIKSLKDQKRDRRKALIEKLDEIGQEYKDLVKLLPKKEQEKHIPSVKKIKYPKERIPDVEFGSDAFSTLRKEFELIRDELERIK